MVKYIEYDAAWDILRRFGFNGELLHKSYDVYYRTTRYSPIEDFYRCQVAWTIERDYGERRADPATAECCIELLDMKNAIWFIWDNRWGNQSIVLVKKDDLPANVMHFPKIVKESEEKEVDLAA